MNSRLENHVLKVKKWNPAKEIPKKEFCYIDLSSVNKDTKEIDENSIQKILGEDAPSRAKQVLAVDDILVATVRPNLNGVALLKKEYQNATASTGYCVLRTTQDLLSKYLYYWVRSPFFIKDMINKATGASYPAVSDKIIKESKIPLPPLPEQKKIAAILDEADQLRQLNQKVLEKYDALTQSLFLEMFGDVIQNPKKWERIPLGKLSSIRRGASPRPIKKFIGGTVPWIKIGDGTRNGDDLYIYKTKEAITEEGAKKSVILEPGSLIFANCGVSLGFARIIKIRGCIHDGWLSLEKIDEKILNKIFLLKLINSITDYFRKTAPDGTQPNLNTKIMKKFSIPLPPIKLQNKFENLYLDIETQKAQAQAAVKESEDLFNSLLQKAFKGELTK